MATSTITSKGQVTIPKTIRRSLMLKTGDKIEFIISENNELLVKPISKKVDGVI
jgi:AbrB family looped-hinge helix DNA binding protein